MEKKYKIREDLSLYYYGRTIYRIEALKDFSDVKIGDIGGYVECEDNLNQSGNCWIYDNAKAMDESKVLGEAVVKNEAILMNKASVLEQCQILDYSEIKGFAIVLGNAKIEEKAILCDKVVVFGRASISEYAEIRHSAQISGDARVFGEAQVSGNVHISDNAQVYGQSKIEDYAHVMGRALIRGTAVIKGSAIIVGDAIIEKTSDYYVSKNTWSSYRYFTYTRSNRKWTVGCFYGTSKELVKKAYKDSKLSGDQYKLITKYVRDMYKLLEGKTPKTNSIINHLKRLFRK